MGELEPYDTHPADPAAIEALAGELTGQARQILDHERATLAAFIPVLAHWYGVASDELRAAPEPVRQTALQSGVALSWGGSVLTYWAKRVATFNTIVRGIQAERTSSSASAVEDDEAEQKAQRRWREVYEEQILGGRRQAAAMLSEGPTSANIEILRQAGTMPAGIDRVFPHLWTDLYTPTTDTVRLVNLNIGMGHKYTQKDVEEGGSVYEFLSGNWYYDRGVEPEEIDYVADLILSQDADIATLQEWHDVPGLQEQLEERLKERTGNDWNLTFTKTDTAQNAAAGYDDTPAGTLIAVQLGDGIASVKDPNLANEVISSEEISSSEKGYNRLRGLQLETENGGTLNVYTTHLPTQGDGISDGEQAHQIDQARELTENDGTPSVVTGDFNQTTDPGRDNLAGSEAIRSFEEAGFTDAGKDAGPTNREGQRIDYVFTDPGAHLNEKETAVFEGDPPDVDGDGQPDVWDDGQPEAKANGTGSRLTDHDGIVVEIDVPSDR